MATGRLFQMRVRTLANRRFWILRNLGLRWRSRAAAAVLRSGLRLRETRSMSRVLLTSSFRTLGALGSALVFVWFTQTAGRTLSERVPRWTWVPSRLQDAATWLGEAAPVGFNYQAVVTAALAVTGTLAGVYFATVTFVVSSTYRDATARVRSLVTRIPEGRVYTFVYVQAVLFALVIVLLPLSGLEPNRLSLLTLAILAALVVTSFGRLRTQLYGLLEPAGLLRVIERDISYWSKYAMRRHGRAPAWRVEKSRVRVVESLITLRELCRLIREREHVSPDPSAEYASVDPRILSAVRSLTSIWMRYAVVKNRLVGVPGWCSPRERHKDWLIADSFEVGIALGTATTLRPDAADDQLWLERHLASVFTDLLANRDVAQYARMTGDLSGVGRRLAGLGLFEDAHLWLDVVVLPARSLVDLDRADGAEGGVASASEQPSKAIAAHQHNLVDFIVLSYSQIALGLHDYAARIAQGFPAWTVPQAHGLAGRPISARPSALFRNLEDGLAFERSTERRRITSDANIHQLAARAIATDLIDEASWFVDALESALMPWVQGLCRTVTLPSAAALSRMYETVHKADEVMLPALRRWFHASEAVHRDVDDKWPDLDTGDLETRLDRLSQDLKRPTAHLAFSADVELDPDRPDVFGWAFHRAHEDLFEDVLGGRQPPDLRERLQHLVGATDRASIRVQSTVRRTHARVANSYRAEPLLLLLQISGMAYVQGILNGKNDLLAVFSDVWGGLLEGDAQQVLDVVLGTLISDNQLLGLSAGKMMRSGREQRAVQSFAFLGERGGSALGRHRRSQRITGADGVQDRAGVLAEHLSVRADFEEVFVAAWLLPEAIARGAVLAPDLKMHPLFDSLVERLASSQADESSAPHVSDPVEVDGSDDA